MSDCFDIAKSQLIGKDPDAGKDQRQREKGVTEDEMVGLHHQLSGREIEQTSGNSGGHRSLACCSPWISTGGSYFWEPCFTLSILFMRLSTSPSQEMYFSSLCNLCVLQGISDMKEMWIRVNDITKLSQIKVIKNKLHEFHFWVYIYEKKTKATNWKRYTHPNGTAAFLQ